jgi:hypothetical protein
VAVDPSKLPEKFHWLPDSEYQKARTQLYMQVGGVMQIFNVYGQEPYTRQATEEIVKLCEDFGLRVRGLDKAISLEYVRRPKW